MLAQTTILSAVTGLFMLAGTASARTWAGPVDMNQACKWQHGDQYYAYEFGGDANGWVCLCNGNGCESFRDIDVAAFCRRRYGGNAYADPQGGGLYDWGCYFP